MNTVVRMVASLGVATLTLGLVACGGETESDDPNNTDDGATTGATTTGSGDGDGDGDGDGGGTPEYGTQTLQTALDDFGACMSIEVFIETGAYRLYEDLAIVGEQEMSCGACHSNGEGGAVISDDVEAMFEGISTFPGVMRVVTGTVREDGNFNTLVPSNRFIDKGIEACYPGELCHPPYDLPQDMQRAILTFTEVSLERWESGECDAPYNPELE